MDDGRRSLKVGVLFAELQVGQTKILRHKRCLWGHAVYIAALRLEGPIAQFVFIPFMTTGAGVDLLGTWFGTGTDRGIALLFTVTGLIGLIVTLMAMRSRSYRKLSANYQKQLLERYENNRGTTHVL